MLFRSPKQKTAYEMNLCDWSSDVCSSDLGAGVWSDFSILDSISRADAETAPDPESATDYARRYANWRLLTDKLGEWRMRMETR